MLRNCECFNPGLGIFPVLFSTLTGLTFIITYIISVSDDDVYPYFPTISDTGGRKPESNVFGLFLSISSFLGFVVVLIRMVQYRHICENNQEDHSKLLLINKVGCVVGAMACFGATLVANYQVIIFELTNFSHFVIKRKLCIVYLYKHGYCCMYIKPVNQSRGG